LRLRLKPSIGNSTLKTIQTVHICTTLTTKPGLFEMKPLAIGSAPRSGTAFLNGFGTPAVTARKTTKTVMMNGPDQIVATVLTDVQTRGSVMLIGAMTPVTTKPVIGTEEIVTKNTVPVEILDPMMKAKMILDLMVMVKAKMMTLDQMVKVKAKMMTPDQMTNSMNLATALQDVQTPGSVMFTGVMTPVGTKPVTGTEEIVTTSTVPHLPQNVLRDAPTRRLVTDGVTKHVM